MSVIELEARDVAIETAPSGLWSDAWYRLRRNPGAIAGFVIIAAVVVIAIFAPLVAPFGPREQNLAALRGGCCPGPSASSTERAIHS
jgi:peptide/nickel transport system permease protein